MWQKMMDKTPKKGEIATKYAGPILGALIKFCYTSGYAYPSSFTGTWDGPAMTEAKREAEFHFRVFQAASELGMGDLKNVAVRNIKARLAGETETNDVAAWLQDLGCSAGGKKDAEPPMAILNIVNEMQARSVRHNMEVKGMSLDDAFHLASKPVPSLFLVDFIQEVQSATGVRLHNYLQCPNCACFIRSKNAATNSIMCTRGNDCKAEDRLGRLVVRQE
jgi:hypothetical protein